MRRLLPTLAVLALAGCGTAERYAYRSTVRDSLKPLIEALETYRSSHGTYPRKLAVLVDEGLLPAVPVVSRLSHPAGSEEVPYGVSPDGSFYSVRFEYQGEPGTSGGEPIGTSVYMPDGRGWRDSSSNHGSYYDAYRGILLARYQEVQTAAALEQLVRHMAVMDTDPPSMYDLWEHQVTGPLGPGTAVVLPPELRTATDMNAVQYTAPDKPDRAFVFAFDARVLPIYINEKQVMRSYPVLRAVYVRMRAADGTFLWNVLSKRV